MAFSLPNISIAILVINLLDLPPNRTRALLALVILQVVFAVVSILILVLMCNPTESLWNKSIEGKCLSPDVMNNFSYWLSAYTTAIDFFLAIVPISAFWNLKIKFNTKLGLCILMGLSLFSAIVTVVKATHLWRLFGSGDPCECSFSSAAREYLLTLFPVYDIVPLILWGL